MMNWLLQARICDHMIEIVQTTDEIESHAQNVFIFHLLQFNPSQIKASWWKCDFKISIHTEYHTEYQLIFFWMQEEKNKQ